MAGQPARLLDQVGQPAPALRALAVEPRSPSLSARSPVPQREGHVVLAGGSVRVCAAGRALDLARGQAQNLAKLADRAARSKSRKGRHQGRAIAPVALVHARDQPLADVAREVQVDVGQPAQFLVQEAPQRQASCDRVDVRQARQVAHQRGHRRPPPSSGRQQRAHRVRPAHLQGDLARQLEHVVVQQEEAGQPEPVDHRELLLQARARLAVGGADLRGRAGRIRSRSIAVFQPLHAQLCQALRGACVLGPRVAIAEIPGQIERQLLGQRERLCDRVGMVGEAAGHRLRRAHHMAVIAAAQRLGGVKGGAVAQRHERILQLGPHARVRVHVAGGHAPDLQPPRQRRQRPVAGSVVAGVRALQLHIQVLRTERVEQPPRRRLVAHAGRRQPGCADHRATGTAGQADQALGVFDHVSQVHPRLAQLASGRPLAGMSVGERDDPAQVAPAALVAYEQRDVAGAGSTAARDVHGPGARGATCALGRIDGHVDLRAVDRPHAVAGGDLGQLHRAGDRVVVGQRQRGVAELAGALGELVWQRHAVQERVRRVAVKLRVGGGGRHLTCLYGSCTNQAPAPARAPAVRSWKTTMLRPRAPSSSQ